MADQDFSNMGARIQSIVEDAVNSMDFDRLNRNIIGSIQSVFDELNIDMPMGNRTGKSSGSRSTSDGRYQRNQAAGNGQTSDVRYHYGSDQGTSDNFRRQATDTLSQRYASNLPGSISGMLYTLGGGFFTVIFAFCLLVVGAAVLTMPGMIFGAGIAIVAILFCLVISIVVLWKGMNKRGRIKRFRSYARVIGKRTFCQIKELAAATGKSAEYVGKDLQKMIEERFFLHGHLDAQRTCLMLDDETYHQYLDAQTAYHQRVLEEEQRRQSDHAAFSSDGIKDQDLIKAIEEGNRYINQIRRANDAIPGEEISAKLFRLEDLIRKIFEVLRRKPDQLPKLRKFMNYYMPTTLKLVQTYQELDAQPVAGANIQKAKKEIEDTLDTINQAYEKLLDSFFEDAAMDVSTDISVLEAMLAQEGLTKNHFEK